MGGLGMPEIIVIMVIALIVFGPRKLPELGKSLGKAMNQFKRASEDFKRTWEQEVDLENVRSSTNSISSSSTSTESHSSSDHNGGVNPYDFDNHYGYNAPDDNHHSETETHHEAEHNQPAQVQEKPQTGQWI